MARSNKIKVAKKKKVFVIPEEDQNRLRYLGDF